MTNQTADGSEAAPHPWVFGEMPLPQTCLLASLLRRVTGLALSLEGAEPTVSRLIDDLRRAETELALVAPADMSPRLGPEPRDEQRVYLDHAHDVGAYNPCFPEYDITVEGARASGTVNFPLVFEGPPSIVHGGVVATFFDCVIQHHNCQVGQAGKTMTLQIRYRRPAPIGVTLRFEIERESSDRITSVARLLDGDELLSVATVEAVAGVHENLPAGSPRRPV